MGAIFLSILLVLGTGIGFYTTVYEKVTEEAEQLDNKKKSLLEEKEKLRNLDVLILNALGKKKHYSHFNLEEALAVVDEIKPKRTYFTHMSCRMGLYEETEKELPENCHLGYDGLQIEL